MVVFCFGWVIYRLPLLKARHELDSWVSKEAAFLANNWILLFSALFVLFATMFPTITEADQRRAADGGPAVLQSLDGADRPHAAGADRRRPAAGLAQVHGARTCGSSSCSRWGWGWSSPAACVALGVRVWSSGICFALCGMVFGTLTQEFLRGANVRRGMTGTDVLTAMIGLVGRNKRRYGGYIVHVGIVLIFLGFAGEGFSRDEQLLLKPGEEATVGDYMLHLDALRVTDDGQKQMVTAHVTVRDTEGKDLGKMRPAKWYFRKHEEEPTTEVGIRRTFAEDLYIVMPAFEMEEQTASVEVHINPLVNWVWFGFGILAIGTGIALLPERAVSFAAARLPRRSRDRVAAVAGDPAVAGAARAQHVETRAAPGCSCSRRKSREVTKKLACWCGGCSKLPVGECSCGHCALVKSEVTQMLKDGQNEEQVLQHFVEPGDHLNEGGHLGKSGLPLLSEPMSGSGRLVLYIPYLLGVRRRAGGAGAGRHLGAPARTGGPGRDARMKTPALRSRLDDELRDLD